MEASIIIERDYKMLDKVARVMKKYTKPVLRKYGHLKSVTFSQEAPEVKSNSDDSIELVLLMEERNKYLPWSKK